MNEFKDNIQWQVEFKERMNGKDDGFNPDIREFHFFSSVGINIIKQVYILTIFLKYFVEHGA